jgi:hypothetical protein
MKAQKLLQTLNKEVEKNKIELEREKQEFANEIKKYKKVDLFPAKKPKKFQIFEKLKILLWGR